MNRIKFSHEYLKFPQNWGEAGAVRLLDVWLYDTKGFSKDFIEYDTTYSEKDGFTEVFKNYPLPEGKVLILVLVPFAIMHQKLLGPTKAGVFAVWVYGIAVLFLNDSNTGDTGTSNVSFGVPLYDPNLEGGVSGLGLKAVSLVSR